MVRITHDELIRLVEISYHAKRPLVVVGAVGEGKSDSIRQASKIIAKKLGKEYTEDWSNINDESKFVLIEQRATRFDPSDIRGLPHFTDGDTVWKKPLWIPKKGFGIIFLEELTQAPPLIQNSLQSLLLTRAVEERKIPDGYGIIAATNRPEDDAAVFEVPSNIKNRLLWAELVPPSVESWCKWAAKNGIHSTVITAIYRNPSWLFQDKVRPEDYAFRRPRTWEYVSDIIKTCERLGSDTTAVEIATAIGEGAAHEFISFLKFHKKLKNFKDILDGKEDPPEELDLVSAMISNIVEYYRHNMNKSVFEKVVKLVTKIKEPEHAVLLLKMMKNIDEVKFLRLANQVDVTPIRDRIGKYIFS